MEEVLAEVLARILANVVAKIVTEDVSKVLVSPEGTCDSDNTRNTNNDLLNLALTKSTATNAFVAAHWSSLGGVKVFAVIFTAPPTPLS